MNRFCPVCQGHGLPIQGAMPIIYSMKSLFAARFLSMAATLFFVLSLSLASVSAGDIPESRLKLLAKSIIDTGLNRDGIPSIDQPKFISVADASLGMDLEEVVFILEASKETYIYPQKIMVWHEIVNDVIEDQVVAVTYCPLTGSTVGYSGEIPPYRTYFGTTGRLVNSNLLMYDRSTNSEWPQIAGTAISGPLLGDTLQAFPILWTTWSKAKAAYPKGKVLSRETGHRRKYGQDPYGSYQRKGNYYDNGNIMFRLTEALDRRYPAKERIMGVSQGSYRVAVIKKAVAKKGVINFEAGATPMVAFYDKMLDTVRVFDRRVKGKSLTFGWQDGEIFDKETHTSWTASGMAGFGPRQDTGLKPVAAMDVMWFGWTAFFPGTNVVQ
jgi:hypothetical protein